MDIRVIPICIMLFWLAGKMTRMQPTKGPAAACTGQCGLLLGLLLSAVPISDLTDSDLCMYVCWKCGYPIPGNLMKEKAGNGLANTSLQGGVRSLCITSSAVCGEPVSRQLLKQEQSNHCLLSIWQGQALKTWAVFTACDPHHIFFFCRGAALCSGGEFLLD